MDYGAPFSSVTPAGVNWGRVARLRRLLRWDVSPSISLVSGLEWEGLWAWAPGCVVEGLGRG